MKKKALVLVIVIFVLALSGCKRIELDETTEKAYVEYAVNAVINHDKNNMLKMERVEIANEDETSWISDEDVINGGENNDGNSSLDNTQNVMTYVDFSKALGNDGLTVKIGKIKECKSYPESDELAFVVTASTGSRLVVVELSITNTTQQTITLDTTDNFSFKGIINGVVRTNALMAFDYSLNGAKHTFTAGETKNLALVFELNNERVSEVDKMVISVVRNNYTYNVNVK